MDKSNQSRLDEWRKDIRAIDQEIIQLSAKRMQLALRIGQYKVEHQLPVKDFRVEKEIIEKTRALAANLGLAPDFAEDLMTLVMGHSVREQNKLHHKRRRESSAGLKEVLIIGGLGRMGRWFSQYFLSIGYEVAIFDSQASGESGHENFRVHESLAKDLERYELILISTPLSATSRILEALSFSQTQAMIIETSSLKAPVKQGIRDLADKGFKIASIHPMFGPDTDLLHDKNIVICTGDHLASEEAASRYFHSTSAQIVKVSIEEHDEHMLSTLGLTHFLNILFGITLRQQGLALKDAEAEGGSSFHDQVRTTKALFSENHELYFDIQAQNPLSKKLYDDLMNNLQTLSNYVLQGQREKFVNQLAEVESYLNLDA